MNENTIAKTDNLPTADEIDSLVKRAGKGDSQAAGQLRKFLESAPAVAEILGGDLAQVVDQTLVRDAAGKNLAFKEAMRQKLLSLRSELAGPTPTPLERLLVDRIATCWLQLHLGELRWAKAGNMTLAHPSVPT